MENLDEINIQEIANKWICPHLLSDNSNTSYESEKQKTVNHLESKVNLEKCSPGILHETDCSSVKDDMTSPSELAE